MRRSVFWGSLFALAYTYAVFPLIVLLRGRLRPRPHEEAPITPRVSIIVAAHNEAAVIAEKIENLRALEYPVERLEIVIASDGSDDGTDEIVRRYVGDQVRLLSLPRQGKANTLNRAVEESTGEILVFSDAEGSCLPGSLLALVRAFADRSVGGVAGNRIYVDVDVAEGTAMGEGAYWDFDRMMKVAQSSAGSITGAAGSLYAIRRSLFRPIPPGVNDDFMNSLHVVEQGSRMLFAPDAVIYGPVSPDASSEYKRKVRVMTRGLRCAVALPVLFDPFRYGFYSLQLFSHKLLMRTMAVPLLILAVVTPLLWRHHAIYRTAAMAQISFYACAAVGSAFPRAAWARAKLFSVPAYFCLVNLASLRAMRNVLGGRSIDLWAPDRGSE